MNGSTGVWGPVPMLPHPQHTADELHIMLTWVFGLEKGKGGPAVSRGLTGQIPVAKSDKRGDFLLSKPLTLDLGRPPAGNLKSGKAYCHAALPPADRSRERRGAWTKNRGKRSASAPPRVHRSWPHRAPHRSGPFRCGQRQPRDCLRKRIGGEDRARLGSATGDLIGSIHAPRSTGTAAWDRWTEAGTQVDANTARARADVYGQPSSLEQSGLMNLDWLQFNPR